MKSFFKNLYSIIPFKKHLFTVLKKVGTPPPSIYKHLHFKGVIRVPVDKTNSFLIKHHGFELENEIFWRGLTNGWEKISINLWIELAKKSQVIFDIGANTGIYSLVAKTVNPSAQVFAFEPVDRVFDKLEQNVDLNKFGITCTKKAVSAKDGFATIFDNQDDHIYSVTVNKNMFPGEKGQVEKKIETISLNSFIKSAGISRIDLMKIDVETHEPEVLAGFSDYLHQFKPTILIEVLDDNVGQGISQAIVGMDYIFFNIDENNGIRRVDTIGKSDFYNYLLCTQEIAKALKLPN